MPQLWDLLQGLPTTFAQLFLSVLISQVLASLKYFQAYTCTKLNTNYGTKTSFSEEGKCDYVTREV